MKCLVTVSVPISPTPWISLITNSPFEPDATVIVSLNPVSKLISKDKVVSFIEFIFNTPRLKFWESSFASFNETLSKLTLTLELSASLITNCAGVIVNPATFKLPALAVTRPFQSSPTFKFKVPPDNPTVAPSAIVVVTSFATELPVAIFNFPLNTFNIPFVAVNKPFSFNPE